MGNITLPSHGISARETPDKMYTVCFLLIAALHPHNVFVFYCFPRLIVATIRGSVVAVRTVRRISVVGWRVVMVMAEASAKSAKSSVSLALSETSEEIEQRSEQEFLLVLRVFLAFRHFFFVDGLLVRFFPRIVAGH